MIFPKEIKLEFMRKRDVFAEIVSIISKNLFLDVHAVTASQDTTVEKITIKNRFAEYDWYFKKASGGI